MQEKITRFVTVTTVSDYGFGRNKLSSKLLFFQRFESHFELNSNLRQATPLRFQFGILTSQALALSCNLAFQQSFCRMRNCAYA